MSASQKYDEMIQQFSNVTGVEADRARFYLESAAWNLQVALGSFYEDDGDVIEEVGRIVAPPLSMPNVQPTPVSKPPPVGNLNSRFATLANLKKEDSSSDEEDGQAFYAGGSERSGQQVLGPSKKKSKDMVADLFKAAKEHGAEDVDPSQELAPRGGSAFRGSGYRLGATETDSLMVAGSSQNRSAAEPRDITLKMWRDGFSIDDGPLRNFDDPANKIFLDSIKRGEIPQELSRQSKGGEVSLNLQDNRHEEYVANKIPLKAFTGTGHMLGSPAPSVTSNPPSEADVTKIQQTLQDVIKIDDTQPVTSVQIRLVDGSRLVARLNHDHTIGDLYHFITTARPQYVNTQFVLMTTFPNKELENKAASLKDASLLNAVIVQRMK